MWAAFVPNMGIVKAKCRHSIINVGKMFKLNVGSTSNVGNVDAKCERC